MSIATSSECPSGGCPSSTCMSPPAASVAAASELDGRSRTPSFCTVGSDVLLLGLLVVILLEEEGLVPCCAAWVNAPGREPGLQCHKRRQPLDLLPSDQEWSSASQASTTCAGHCMATAWPPQGHCKQVTEKVDAAHQGGHGGGGLDVVGGGAQSVDACLHVSLVRVRQALPLRRLPFQLLPLLLLCGFRMDLQSGYRGCLGCERASMGSASELRHAVCTQETLAGIAAPFGWQAAHQTHDPTDERV